MFEVRCVMVNDIYNRLPRSRSGVSLAKLAGRGYRVTDGSQCRQATRSRGCRPRQPEGTNMDTIRNPIEWGWAHVRNLAVTVDSAGRKRADAKDEDFVPA